MASRIGVNALGHVWALHYLLTSLLITLREKGPLTTGDLEVILEATSTTLKDKVDRLAADTPKGAEMFEGGFGLFLAVLTSLPISNGRNGLWWARAQATPRTRLASGSRLRPALVANPRVAVICACATFFRFSHFFR